MARIPDFKRIAKEDFPPEDHALIEKLAFPLNSHMEQVRNALNKGINFDNLAQELITLRIQTGGDSKPLSTVTFKSNLANKVRGILVVSASIASDNLAYPSQMPFISFSQNLNIITVNNIAGLSANTTYDLLLLTIS